MITKIDLRVDWRDSPRQTSIRVDDNGCYLYQCDEPGDETNDVVLDPTKMRKLLALLQIWEEAHSL